MLCKLAFSGSWGRFRPDRSRTIRVKGSNKRVSLYRSRHELIAVFKHGKVKHRNNVQLGAFGRNRTNVWEYASPNSFGHNAEGDDTASVHPTMKGVTYGWGSSPRSWLPKFP